MSVTLSAAVGYADTSIGLSAELPTGTRDAMIESEQVRILSSGTTSIVARGVNGTAAVPHAEGTTVQPVQTVESSIAPGSSSSSPADLPANGNALGIWANAKASGDHRGIYARLFAAIAGASGEAIRAYGTVVSGIAAAVGGTINGLHASLKVAGTGTVSGSGNAIRATLETDANGAPGGTLAVVRADSNLGTGTTLPATAAFIALDNVGAVKVDLLAMITSPSTTMFATAGTGANSAALAGGGVAAKVLKVTVDGTAYWIPLFSSNS